MAKDKTGVEISGLRAINPATGKEIPVWVSDYVLMSYGTGAIMAVPAHDSRDWEFAKKFGLPMVEVVSGGDIAQAAYEDIAQGTLVNSDFLNGLSVPDAKKKIIDWLTEKGLGVMKVNFKLRDWVSAAQRYWGSHPWSTCPQCGAVPVPQEQLPVLLPQVDNYEPTDDGESPFSAMTDWVNVPRPRCVAPPSGKPTPCPSGRQQLVLPAYCDPATEPCRPEALNYFMPVDWYNGGMEHTTLHSTAPLHTRCSTTWALFPPRNLPSAPATA